MLNDVSLTPYDNLISENTFDGCNYGIMMASGQKNIITDNLFYQCIVDGINLANLTAYNTISNNIFTGSGTAEGIDAKCHDCIISSNIFINCLRSIVFRTESYYNLVENNMLHNEVLEISVDNIFRNNFHFKTENSGTGTTSGGSLVVSHGLDYTPTIDEFSITLGTNASYWIDTITATQFTLHTSTPAVSFGWAIRRV